MNEVKTIECVDYKQKKEPKMTEIKLNVYIPKGYEATGEFRQPTEDDHYIAMDGSERKSIYAEGPRIILKKKEPKVVEVLYGNHAVAYPLDCSSGIPSSTIKFVPCEEHNAKYRITIEEI